MKYYNLDRRLPDERGRLAAGGVCPGAPGLSTHPQAENADVIVLNTCVVRQSAEDKAYGRLTSLRPLKKHIPNMVINLMGCLVGVHGAARICKKRFPYRGRFLAALRPRPAGRLPDPARSRQIEENADRRALCLDGRRPGPA